jgi:glycosyltransferase 2 family protein
MKWETIRKYLPIIGIVIFIYLLIKLNISRVFTEIGNLKLSYFFIALLLIFFFFTIQTLKWFVIARKQKINVPFKEAFRINLIGNFYGFITPSKIGSVIRMDYLKKYGGDTGKGLSNFVIDKILDLSSIFVLVAGLGFIFYGEKIIPHAYLNLIIILFLVMIFSFLFFYKKETSKPVLRFIYRKLIPQKMKEKGRIIFESFYKDLPSLGFLFFVFVINLITWVIDYFAIYFLGLSLGINVGFIPFLIILPIATLVAQIPITIDGFGTRELTMINLFALFGVEGVKVLSMSILGIFITGVIPSIITMFLLLSERKNSKIIQKTSK